jgi:tetratricopeptide (TPR) repeat protein
VRADQAEKHYQAALAARPADAVVLRNAAAFYLRGGQGARAEPHLRGLLAAAGAAAEDVAWARRELAVALAARGDYRQSRAALALLEANRQAQQQFYPRYPDNEQGARQCWKERRKTTPFVYFDCWTSAHNRRKPLLFVLGSTEE